MKVERKPLTAEQRDLAARHVNYCYQLARPFHRRVPRLYGEIKSAAFWGLMRAAELYDPKLGFRFMGFARPFILWAIREEFAKDRCHGLRGFNSKRRGQAVFEHPGLDDRLFGPDRRPHQDAVDRAESFEAMCSMVPENFAVVLRMYYRDGCDMNEIGRELGITKQGVSYRHHRALEILARELPRPSA